MMKRVLIFLVFLILLIKSQLSAQSLLDSLDSIIEQPKQTEYTEATFKATSLVNGQTVELLGKNELAAIISHRFGPISQGSYEFFGLTTNKFRLGLDYGLFNRINLGLGVGNDQRLIDGNIKVKLLRQSSGEHNFPFTIVYSSTGYYTFTRWVYPSRNNLLSSRFFYSHQLLVARKFNNRISLQVTPGIVHRNLVQKENDQNNVYSVAMGGRYKITKRLAMNAEYYYLLPGKTKDGFVSSLSLGLDIETGGHVFQLILTNSESPQEKVFIPETFHKWTNGDIHFGFNIIRVFGMSKHKQE